METRPSSNLPIKIALESAGFAVTEQDPVCQLEFKNHDDKKIYTMIVQGLTKLREINANPMDHFFLFKKFIRMSSSSSLRDAVEFFNTLTEFGFDIRQEKNLSLMIKLKFRCSAFLNKEFESLYQAGMSFDGYFILYKKIVDSIYIITRELSEGFIALYRIGLPKEEIVVFFDSPLPPYVDDLLKWMLDYKVTRESHAYLCNSFLRGEDALIYKPHLASKIQARLEKFMPLLSHQAANYAEQSSEIKKTIADCLAEEELTEGPLNKSLETNQLEIILKRMIKDGIDTVTMQYNDHVGYVLQFGEEPEIYLSEILNRVMFQHLILTNMEINAIGELIKKVAEQFDSTDSLVDEQGMTHLTCLPIAAQKALDHYVQMGKYGNINRLFRGVAQDKEDYRVWIEPANGKENLLANFLTGCLVNWSAAKLSCLLTKISEPDYLPPAHELIRHESLENPSSDAETETKRQRQANPQMTGAPLSFSAKEGGEKWFESYNSTSTSLLNNKSRPIISINELEVLIPGGTCLIYTKNNKGHFFAREVNSPAIHPTLGLWSSTALAQAYLNHLSKSYADAPNALEEVNGVKIFRPNHGLAHTYRVMMYIDIVIDYFAHHAKDAKFQAFCQDIDSTAREWLRVAAAYRVTGRESEVSVSNNAGRYNQYKEASRDHMHAFIQRYRPPVEDKFMSERILHVLQWMGNPNYENEINSHSDLTECAQRNFLYRILTVAHQLDLPRCYHSDNMNRAMEMCLSLSNSSIDQQGDYSRMVNYAINMIRAHGDQLFSELNSKGVFQNADVEGYRPPFDKVSVSLRHAFQYGNTVPRPRLTESYQFPRRLTE